MKAKILLILFLISCQSKDLQNRKIQSFLLSFFNKIFSKSSATIDIELNYGEKFQFNQPFSANLAVQTTKNLCFISSSPTSKQMEFGLFIQLCYPNKNEPLQKIIQNWQEEPKSLIQSEFSIFEMEHRILSITRLKQQLQLEKIEFAVLGDKLLQKELSKLNFHQKLFYKEHLGTSFAIPYFSFFVTETKVFLLFPPKPPLQKDKNYFLIKLDISYKEQFTQFFQKIKEKNSVFLEKCKEKDPILTEVFSYSLGPEKFIEIKNSTNDILCFLELTLSLKGKDFQLKNPLGFLFPKSILLFSDTYFYESLPIDKSIWNLLKQEKEVSIQGFERKNQKLSDNIYRFENEYFSNFLSEKKSCSNLIKIYEIEESFCGNPGIDTERELCDLQDFQLSEINPYGIEYKSKVEPSQKFIEIYYKGNRVCDLSNFEILFNETSIPLASESKLIYPKSIFLIGQNLYLEHVQNFIKRNLSFFNQDTKIYLLNKTSKEKKKLFDNTNYLIYKNSEEEIFSLVQISDNILIYYPFLSSSNLKPYIKNHRMGPGKKEEITTSSLSVYFSEVNSIGSYEGNRGHTSDEFIEFFSPKKNLQTIHLEIEEKEKTRKKIFLLPIKKGYNILSKRDFFCYNTKDLQHKDFSLSGKVFNFKITNPFEKQEFSVLQVDQKKDQGLNNTTGKKRASYIFSGYENYWFNSSLKQQSIVVKESCRNGSFASPKSKNLFAPFFISKEENKNQVEFDFFYSSLSAVEMKTKQYTIAPLLSKNINLPIKKTYNIKPDENFDKNALIYLELSDYQKLFLYNQSELYLEGVNAYPKSSKNRWILICNRNQNQTYDLTQFFIQDEDYPNKKSQIITYKDRKPAGLPDYIDSTKFISNKELPPNFCGYIIRIDNTTELSLPLTRQLPIRIFTTKIPFSTSKSLLYRGMSNEDQIDLYQTNGTKTIHIHSYGNRHSNFPFKIRLPKGKIAYLKEKKQGKEKKDYEIR